MEFYHVINRGVEKRNIVINDGDRMRFVKSLYVFNDSASSPNSKTQPKMYENIHRHRNLLVHIHAWCLMDNHYHLLLSPVDNDLANLSLFMKKLNGGYAKYFNEKYDRSGYLWQGKYKKILIERDSHFIHIPYYIHLNPLDYTNKEWRKGKIKNIKSALKKLHEYRWSSFLDYTGTKNFPSLIKQYFLKEILGSKSHHEKEILKIISDENLASGSQIIEK